MILRACLLRVEFPHASYHVTSLGTSHQSIMRDH